MNGPKVSIITACYNNARTIEKTIFSVLNQTYVNIEYIIVDANSNDGTYEIIQRYKDRIAQWIREPDTGIADAWNKGIEAATGSIIGLINADDCYTQEAVELAVHAILSHTDHGFVFSDLKIVDQNGHYQYTLIGNSDYDNIISFDMPSIPHPTVFVKREVYTECGLFNTDYRSAMDYEFLLRIYKLGIKGYYCRHVWAIMMLGGESDSNYRHSHREVAKISIQYGYDQKKAICRYYRKLGTSLVRRVIEKVGLIIISRFVRKIFRKQYEYK